MEKKYLEVEWFHKRLVTPGNKYMIAYYEFEEDGFNYAYMGENGIDVPRQRSDEKMRAEIEKYFNVHTVNKTIHS
jgi:hypothetical protein